MILHRYFAKRFVMTFIGVFAVFFLIMFFIEMVEQLRRYARVNASFGDVVSLTLLTVPQGIYRILPLITILAAITMFLGLARSSELVVTRAAGRSGLTALTAPLLVALALGILTVAIFNPIVAATSRQYEARVGTLIGNNSVLLLGSSGLWLRQGSAIGQTVIRAKSANLDGTTLTGVTFTSFADGLGPTRRIEAVRAQLDVGTWTLQDAKSWPIGAGVNAEANATRHATLNIPSTLTATQIRDSFGTPSSIPIWELPAFIARLQTAGFSAQRHKVWFQMELALPVFLVAMVMIGATFTMRHQRSGRTGLMVLIAVLLSFGLYFIRNFAQILGENGQLPAALAAWAPPLAAIGLSLGMLLHQEDG
jgi:lipopolysaccharide export system permease protein